MNDESLYRIPVATHCSRCGSPLEKRVDQDGYDSLTGLPKMKTGLYCPKFARSWRNGWMGGIRHDAFPTSGSGTHRGPIAYEWR